MHSARSVLPRPDEEPFRPGADVVRELPRIMVGAIGSRPDREP
jgi:hypothetical protein